jgi:signal peptidase II
MSAANAPVSVAVAAPLPAGASGWRFLPLTLAVILADQLSKAWVVQHFAHAPPLKLLPVLELILTFNTGAAFSFLSDAAGWQRWFFVALALLISGALLAWMRRLSAARQGLLATALALIAGGALGNMIDRLTRGRVVDFVLAHWREHYFPAFNVADSAITIGAALLLLDAYLESRTPRGGA